MKDYSNFKRWELIIMLVIVKTLKFCNGKMGEFILSFILVAGPSLLLLGNSLGVWITILITHFISLMTVGRLRSDEEKLDFDDEMSKEIKTIKSALRKKKNK